MHSRPSPLISIVIGLFALMLVAGAASAHSHGGRILADSAAAAAARAPAGPYQPPTARVCANLDDAIPELDTGGRAPLSIKGWIRVRQTPECTVRGDGAMLPTFGSAGITPRTGSPMPARAYAQPGTFPPTRLQRWLRAHTGRAATTDDAHGLLDLTRA